MDENMIADLKQFIAAQTQHTADIRGDISEMKKDVARLKEDVYDLTQDVAELKQGVGRIDRKVDDLIVFVSDALDASNEITEQQLKDHERRIVRLERKTA